MGKKRNKKKGGAGPDAMDVTEGVDRTGGGASAPSEAAMDTTEVVATTAGVVKTSATRKGFLVGRNKNEAQIRKNKKKRKVKALERALVVQEKEHNKVEKEKEKKERIQTLKKLY